MKTTRYSTIRSVAVLLLALSSCVKDDLVNTPHPKQGAVVVTADFSQYTEGVSLPAEYQLSIGGENVTAPSTGDFCHPALFNPGTYSLTGCTYSGKMTVSEEILSVNILPDGMLEPLPDYLFTARQEIRVIKDDTTRVRLPMMQRVRDVRFELTVVEGDPGRITNVTSTLKGIAGRFDLAAQQPMGGAGSVVAPAFVCTGDKITACLRLLGPAEDKQILTLVLTFADGNRQTVTEDLSELFADFNDDMPTPLTLKANLNTPIEAGFTATITDWEAVANENVDLH